MEKNNYYVDKTLLIKELLESGEEVTLFTRPRRFGKTMNMEMLRAFFELDTEALPYLKKLKIGACGDACLHHCGAYPVIYLTLKEVKGETFVDMYLQFTDVIRQEVERLTERNAFANALPSQQRILDAILNETAEKNHYRNSLKLISRMLEKNYGTKPIILIDEYDAPIQSAYENGYYEEAISFLKLWLTGGLKDNNSLAFAVLTGVTRIAKESIFSDLNNLTVNTVLDDRYSEFFGFTEEEVLKMANYYGVPEKMNEIRAWYDGYRFGSTDVYNPWSVANYFAMGYLPKLYWGNTSENGLLTSLLQQANPGTDQMLLQLLEGNCLETTIYDSMVYGKKDDDAAMLYTQLVMTGYLKAEEIVDIIGKSYLCKLKIPNKEVKELFADEVIRKCQRFISRSFLGEFSRALTGYDPDKMAILLNDFLKTSVSSFDSAYESFFHGLILGMCAMLYDQYYMESNREAGYGRFDIQLAPREENPEKTGILMELKAEASDSTQNPDTLAEKAMKQIKEKEYFTSLKNRNCSKIYLYGIAFKGKFAVVKSEIIEI